MRRSPGADPRHHGNHGAFTLIEILVVMTLIGILLAIGLTAFDSNEGVPLGVAAEQFSSLARTGRERALAEGKPVLLAFQIGGTQRERDRRTMYLSVEEDDTWRKVSGPDFFPEGVFLDTDRSSGLRAGTFTTTKNGGEESFLGLVFRPDQFCEEGGARLVFGAGSRQADGPPKMKRDSLATGFLVSRTGHVTAWPNPEEAR